MVIAASRVWRTPSELVLNLSQAREGEFQHPLPARRASARSRSAPQGPRVRPPSGTVGGQLRSPVNSLFVRQTLWCQTTLLHLRRSAESWQHQTTATEGTARMTTRIASHDEPATLLQRVLRL